MTVPNADRRLVFVEAERISSDSRHGGDDWPAFVRDTALQGVLTPQAISEKIEALRALGDALGVGVVVFLEGEEEFGSGSLEELLATHRDQLAAEVAALEADEADREEMRAVASLMESWRAPG